MAGYFAEIVNSCALPEEIEELENVQPLLKEQESPPVLDSDTELERHMEAEPLSSAITIAEEQWETKESRASPVKTRSGRQIREPQRYGNLVKQ